MTPIYIRQSGCSISSIRPHYVESQHILYWSNGCVPVVLLTARRLTQPKVTLEAQFCRVLLSIRLQKFDITILLRPTRSPAGYEALGLKTLSGSDADLSLLRAQAAAADVVFATVCSALTLATLENQRAHRQTVTTFRQPRRFFRALRIATRRQGRPHPHPHRKLSLLNTLTILNSRIVWHRRTYQQRSRAA